MTQTAFVMALALIAHGANVPDADTGREPRGANGGATSAVAPERGPHVTLEEGVIVLPPALPAPPGGGPLIIEVPARDPNVASAAGPEEDRRPAAEGTAAEERPTEEIASPSETESGSGSGEPGTTEVIGGATHRVIQETRDAAGRVVQVVRDDSGSLMEIVRDPDGSLVSARGLASGE